MNTTTDILNPEEIEAVKVLKCLANMSDDVVRRVLWEVAYDVESFTTSNYRNGHRAADWFRRVAEALSGQTFHMSKYAFTMDDVINAVEKAIGDAATEYREYWEDAPEDFVEWHPTAKMGDNGPIDHPWGDDEVAVLRKWLVVRPYRIWAVYNAVQVAATYAMNEALLDMATETEDDSDLRRVTKEAFDKAVAVVRKDLSADLG